MDLIYKIACFRKIAVILMVCYAPSSVIVFLIFEAICEYVAGGAFVVFVVYYAEGVVS